MPVKSMESEVQHMSICDRAVRYEDIIGMADKISSSSSKKLSIEFRDCDLTANHLKCLCDEIKDAHCQITTFTISYMDNINELLEKTCFIIGKCKTESLSFEYDDLNDESIELFHGYLEDAKIESLRCLDISYNSDISVVGFEQLGKIMKKFNIKSLKATDCDITDEKLEKFLEALQGVRLKELDIGRNKNLTNEGFRTLAKFVTNKGLDRLELSGCKLSKVNIDIFNEFLPQTGEESSLKAFDVSYNATIEPGTSLGFVVVKFGVTNLSIAGCKLNVDHLVYIAESMKNHTLDLVNMRDNASIGHGIVEIAKIAQQCKVKELNLCDCMFSAQDLESFRKTLNGAKVSQLHLGDQQRDPDEKYIDELCALLKNVDDVLYLRFHKLRNDFCTSLQDNCHGSVKINLTIGDKQGELSSNKGWRSPHWGQ